MASSYVANKFNIFDVFQTVFGYRAIPFPQALSTTANRLNPVQSERLSKLGAVLFKADENGVEAFCPVTISSNGIKYELPYSTIAITMNKNIVKTAMPTRRGTVKELIQVEDIQFEIKGIILGSTDEQSEDFHLPQDKLANFNELFNINEPVQLENAFTDIFLQDDNNVVIESMTLPDMKGVSGAQAYSIRVVSDTILELEEQ